VGPPKILMKKSKKFYKEKNILQRIEKAKSERNEQYRLYWRRNGYAIRMVLSYAGKKHPLANEIRQVLPLVAPRGVSNTPSVSGFAYNNIDKDLYLKLTTSQKMLFIQEKLSLEEIVSMYTNNIPMGKWYQLDDWVKKLLVPCIYKNYYLTYNSRQGGPEELRNQRDNLDAYICGHYRYSDYEYYNRHKFINNKELLKIAREEILELS